MEKPYAFTLSDEQPAIKVNLVEILTKTHKFLDLRKDFANRNR